MSTRSTIWVKINKEDFGKSLMCDINKLPNPLIENNYPCGNVKIHPNPIDDTLYLGIYCHFDGYPEGVGAELINKFNTYESALNLILLGGCSHIITDIKSYHNWRNEDIEIYSVQGRTPTAGGDMISHKYVFENGKWGHNEVFDCDL